MEGPSWLSQCQMDSPENNVSNIIWTELYLEKNQIYIYTYMHAITIGGEKGMNLKESNEGYMGGVKQSKEKGEM